jgi:hypothetical protein
MSFSNYCKEVGQVETGTTVIAVLVGIVSVVVFAVILIHKIMERRKRQRENLAY